MEGRGLDAVKILLAISTGPGEGAVVHGLSGPDEKWISRSDAEAWVREQVAAASRQETCRFAWTIILTAIGAVAAVIAAIEAGLVLR